MADNALIFSTALATVYKINSTNAEELWRAERPIKPGRIKLMSYSSIFYSPKDFMGTDLLMVPHPDGFVSVIDFHSGHITRTIQLGVHERAKHSSPDIVAPLLYVGGTLWAASMDFGISRIDPRSGQVVGHIPEKQIQNMTSDNEYIYAVTGQTKNLIALSQAGTIVWKKDLDMLLSTNERLGFPFEKFDVGAKKVFDGTPSRLLVKNKVLIVASSLGAMGIFNVRNGDRIQVVGNSLGFGPKISFLGNEGVIAVTTRGSLFKASFLF
jgi:outer membrane protein assembly factor BamB